MQRAQHPPRLVHLSGFSHGFSPRRLAVAGLLCLGVALSPALNAADAIDAAKRAINTVCPVSGKKIDPNVEPVPATKNGRTVMIGADNAIDAATIKANPAKYVDAALANRKADP
jgi:hypothetical protein